MRVNSFCSGCGGMDLGFEQAGHKIIYAMDFDKYCKQSYDANFDIDMTLADLKTLKADDVPESDIWIAGIPCQPFSVAGKGKGVEDERCLIDCFMGLIGVKKPSWVVIENVKGLLSKRHRPSFDALIQKLLSFGYIVSWKVLNSKDFGVPQNRNRVFIVAGPREFVFPKVEILTKCLADIMDDVVDDKYYLSDKAIVKLRDVKKVTKADIASTVTAGYYKMGWRGNYIKLIGKTTDRETPRNNPLHPDERIYDSYGISTSVTSISSQHPYIKVNEIGFVGNAGVINQGGILNRVYGKDGIAPTTISSGGRLVYAERIRRLTPRECMRLQGFPESYEQVVSDSQFYKQAGNAVTVNVAKALGAKI